MIPQKVSGSGATVTLPYSLSDWEYIENHYHRQPVAVTARKVEVLPSTLRAHVSKYRTARDGYGPTRRGEYTATDLARAIGCCPMMVTRWARRGLLGAHYTPHMGAPSAFSEDCVRDFLHASPLLWRRYPVPRPVWQHINGCGLYTPGTGAWHAVLAPWPCPGQGWLNTFLRK